MNNLLWVGAIVFVLSFLMTVVLPPDRVLLTCSGIMRLLGIALIIVGVIRVFAGRKNS